MLDIINTDSMMFYRFASKSNKLYQEFLNHNFGVKFSSSPYACTRSQFPLIQFPEILRQISENYEPPRNTAQDYKAVNINNMQKVIRDGRS